MHKQAGLMHKQNEQMQLIIQHIQMYLKFIHI